MTLKSAAFSPQLRLFQVTGLALKSSISAIACSLVLTACGGNDSRSTSTAARPADLSLVAGHIETFNGVGSQARLSKPNGVALDSSGNAYITQTGLHAVRRISPAGVVTVFAGDPANAGSADGTGAGARFSSPGAIAVDKENNVYVLDTGNYTVRKISPSGQVMTIAGNLGMYGNDDGKGIAARFSNLNSIAVNPSGEVFVAQYQALRKIATDGTVTTLVIPATALQGDIYLAADTGGNVFIASGTVRLNAIVRSVPVLHKLTPAGVVTQIYTFSTDEIDGAISNFGGIAVDAAGHLYLSNGVFTNQFTPNSSYTSIGNTVLKLSPEGELTTIAGARGQSGFKDGQGLDARFDEPRNLATDGQGNLVVADGRNDTIRVISSSGSVSTLAGRATSSVDGLGNAAQLKAVVGLASDQRGNVVVAERSALRSLSTGGTLTTTLTDNNGKFQNLALDSRGFMYVSNFAGTFSNTLQFAPTGVRTDASYPYYPSSLAVNAQDDLFGFGVSQRSITNLNTGKSLADLGEDAFAEAFVFDSEGNAYVANRPGSNILKVSTTGTVSVLAGRAGEPGYKDGAAQTAQFNYPEGIAVIGTDVYVADTGNNLIRKISQDGSVTTVAGTPGNLDTVMGSPGAIYRPTYLTAESSSSLLVVVDGKAIVRVRLQ